MKILVLFMLFLSPLLFYGKTPVQSDEAIVKGIADRILQEHTNQYVGKTSKNVYNSTAEIPDNEDVSFKSSYMDWHYSMGVLDMAMVRMSHFFKDKKYLQFAIDHVNYAFQNEPFFEKRKEQYPHGPFHFMWKNSELDHCGAMGAAIIDLEEIQHQTEYEVYIKNTALHISEKQERLEDGTLVRTWPYRYTLWADDLYMAVSFLARMGKYSKDEKYWNDAILQIEKFNQYLFCPETGLYYHCYYSDLQTQGGAHWGRCNGWIMLGTTHLIDALPENHPKRNEMIRYLKRHIHFISRYQNENGLWNQLLDKKDSYLESSCSAIYTYCIAHAINNGWLDKRYASVALHGWNGLKEHKISDKYVFKDVCVGTGIGNDLSFYYKRPVRDNDTHGMGLVLDAGIEMIRLKQLLQINN